ncbi:MAG: anti-sigma F factor [Oscillospiraceae bacterium]|nr:anti-sigma F factor [Oscillospiraceae bacterium]MBQ5313877.1 anti-sigma F factor [Oscillospiraceae bacterium]MBQ5324312.1 anti-sigma F factor [Oscillospiraceae bacterium]MBQ7006327.1 anti-sigma F factor [Oscillospiraceae bacterium]
MKYQNFMKLSFPSKSANEGFARAAVAAFCAQLDPTVEQINDIKTSVSEAVTNCIVHGYRDTFGVIYITATIKEDTVTIKIADKGVGIEDVSKAMQPLFTTDPNGERAGIGFAVMQSFMDSVKVKSALGKGTRVVMTKKIIPRDKNVIAT